MIFYPADILRNYFANLPFNRAQARKQRRQDAERGRADVCQKNMEDGERAVADCGAQAGSEERT